MDWMLRRLPLLLSLVATLAVAGCSGHGAVKQDVSGTQGYVGGNLALTYVAAGHRHAPSAVTGKLLGCGLAARAAGLSWQESSSLGVLMNCRGMTGLIVLNIGLDLKVITPTMFAMLVVMALVTTILTGPGLSLVARISR